VDQEDKSRLLISFVVGACVVALIFGGFALAMRFSGQSRPAMEKPLPFGPAEQAYASNIHFQNLEMSGFENMLHQKVTFINGEITNNGPRSIAAADVTVVFYGQQKKVVMRETRRVIGEQSRPLETGGTRDMQIGFETIPKDWNHEFPAVRVTGLVLQ
jgi:hypothetical protein